MKESIKTISKLLGICLITGSILTSCSKDSPSELDDVPTLASNQSFREMIENTPNHPILKDSEAELLEKIIVELGQLTNDPNFQFDVYMETSKQMSGDYDFKISDLAGNVKSSNPNRNSVLKLNSLASEYKEISGGVELIVYYPRTMVYEKRGIAPNYKTKNQADHPKL